MTHSPHKLIDAQCLATFVSFAILSGVTLSRAAIPRTVDRPPVIQQLYVCRVWQCDEIRQCAVANVDQANQEEPETLQAFCRLCGMKTSHRQASANEVLAWHQARK